MAQLVKNLLVIWETWVLSLGWEDPLEKGTTTHSSILAWRIPWTEEPGRSHKESDTTEQLSLFSFVGVGVILPLQLGYCYRQIDAGVDCSNSSFGIQSFLAPTIFFWLDISNHLSHSHLGKK